MCPLCKAQKSKTFNPIELLKNERLCFKHAFNDFLEDLDFWLQAIEDERKAQRKQEHDSITRKEADYYESQLLPKQPI